MRKKWIFSTSLVFCILLAPFIFKGDFKSLSSNFQSSSINFEPNIFLEEESHFKYKNKALFPPELIGIETMREVDQDIDLNQSFSDKISITNPIPENYGLRGDNVTIAILDSGINDSDWITPSKIIQRISIPANTSSYDEIGHGTSVGSIIAKIAPQASIISIRVSDNQGEVKTEWLEEGLLVAQSMNASIIHASIGSPNMHSLNTTILSDLISENISLVFAAGNSGPFGGSLTSPAIYQDAIGVGMVFNESFIPSSSSLGPRPSGLIGPDLVAPGVYIPSYNASNDPTNVSGTSFAAPIVTGSLALLKGYFPDTPPSILKAALLNTARQVNNSQPIQQGNGIINVNSTFHLLNNSHSTPFITFAPREISSDYSFFGQALNGLNHNYTMSLYSSHAGNFSVINQTNISPFQLTNYTHDFEIFQGQNFFNFSLFIPPDLVMEDWKKNVTFEFTLHNQTIIQNLSIHIENKYPGGRVIFYQGYDNDTFIPDGPTGAFSQLSLLLETYYGMHVTGAIRPDIGLALANPLLKTTDTGGKITVKDLENQDILILADIELGISNEEIDIIENWVNEGHSLLVLSYPSYKENGIERLSNQTAVNDLLNRFDMEIEDDNSSPSFTKFSQGTTKKDSPIFSEDNLPFEYNGTTVKVYPQTSANVLATAQNLGEELAIAGYWENTTTKGKVVAFGGLDPFSDLSITSINQLFNIKVVNQIFRWLINDQQIAIEIILTSNPSLGSSTKIQLNIPSDQLEDNHFSGTIIEANGSYTQIQFEPSFTTYVGTWIPKAEGNAILWLNLPLTGGTPTNGVFLLPVAKTDDQSLFMIALLGSFVLIAIGYYWVASRRTKSQLSIEEQINLQYHRSSASPTQKSLVTLEICNQCKTPRFDRNSKYCYKCGKEL